MAEFLAGHVDKLDASGRARLVRNGHLPERTVQTGIGAVTVKAPRACERGQSGAAAGRRRVAVRQVVLDTETTGLNAKLGDRVIEIGCLELLLNRRPTGNHFHHYLNPERASEEGAVKVHGISDEF